GGDWKSDGWNLQDGNARVVSAEPLYPVINKNQARLVWHQSVRKGEKRQFFTVVTAEKPGKKFTGLRLSANAAVFRVPETVIVSAGVYLDVHADLAVQSEAYFFAS